MAAQNLDRGEALASRRPVFVSPAFMAEALEDEITIRDFALLLWRCKWIVAATTLVVVALVSAWMKASTPLYTASMVVAPANEAGAGGAGGRLAHLSGLAALAGVDLGKDSVSPFMEFMEIIKSTAVAERLASRHDILAKLFEKSWSWDGANRNWVRRESLLTPIGEAVRAFFDLPPPTPPSPRMLADYLQNELTIAPVEETGMQRIEFSHEDPVFAANMLRWLHDEGDGLIRAKQEARTSRQIAYIERKLQVVTAADHRRSLVQLLLDQERQMMLIQVDLPFAARIIEPPNVSDDPTSPRPFLFIALAVIIGLLLGILAAFLLTAIRRRPPAEPRSGEAPEARPAAPQGGAHGG